MLIDGADPGHTSRCIYGLDKLEAGTIIINQIKIISATTEQWPNGFVFSFGTEKPETRRAIIKIGNKNNK